MIKGDFKEKRPQAADLLKIQRAYAAALVALDDAVKLKRKKVARAALEARKKSRLSGWQAGMRAAERQLSEHHKTCCKMYEETVERSAADCLEIACSIATQILGRELARETVSQAGKISGNKRTLEFRGNLREEWQKEIAQIKERLSRRIKQDLDYDTSCRAS